MSIPVVVLGQNPELVHRIESYRGDLMVARVCQEISEAVAACAAGVGQALIVSDPELMLPMEQVDYVREHEVVLVLLDDKPVSTPGVLSATPSGSAAELESLITRGLRQFLDAVDSANPGTEDGVPRQERAKGSVTTFWGAVGAPGRSTLALNFAVEAAVAGQKVILIDADTYGASIAVQLGLLDESAAVAQICRVVDTGHYDVARLESVCKSLQVGSAVLTVASGIPRASRWPEIRAASLRRAVGVFKQHYDRVVLDVAAPVETDEQLSFDTRAPQRNGVTVEALHFSDEVFMVVAADSVGIPRAIRAIDELNEQQVAAPLRILFNKIGTAAAGRSPRRGVSEAWERFGPSYPIIGFLPDDHQTCQAAILAGSALLELAPRCALRSEIRALTQKNLPFRTGSNKGPSWRSKM
ncbi:chromosome partitioning protein [Glutamicibacter sp. MNS18]|uniref:AAA family ATPase n=1 Tax=Glutamicibacter sp. MNS18 TaxID=2989817 RepID=UPI00223608A9|nr:chromosome partitioning protein [Glutamicibacter sp. MNS18]MCW4464402.1 chromosome partitioning protein [Glutamicibacter sp. MNS18]